LQWLIKNGKNHLEDIGSGWFAFANAHAYSTPTVTVYLTVKDTGQRLAKAGELSFQNLPQPAEGQETIFVDPTKKFQTALDIGGALTAAAAETFYKLPADRGASDRRQEQRIRLGEHTPTWHRS
jgi:glucosylceramidase